MTSRKAVGETHSQFSLPLSLILPFPLPLPFLNFSLPVLPSAQTPHLWDWCLRGLPPGTWSRCHQRGNMHAITMSLFPITLVPPKVWCTSVKHSSMDLKGVGGFGMMNTIMIGSSNIHGSLGQLLECVAVHICSTCFAQVSLAYTVSPLPVLCEHCQCDNGLRGPGGHEGESLQPP